MGIGKKPAATGPLGGQGAGGQPQEIPQWEAPTDVEWRLYQAKAQGDWDAYLDVLASTDLYHAMPRGIAEANPGKVLASVYWEPRTRTECYAYFTPGMLSAPAPDPVFYMDDLATIVEYWPRPNAWLAINPGTPCEAFFPATPADRDLWAAHAREAPEPPPMSIRTLRIGGPVQGPVAHGMACAALLFVKNNEIWNSLGHGKGFVRERKRLERWWGVTSREKWFACQTDLLQAEMTSSAWEFVLSIRRGLARRYGGAVDAPYWRGATERVLRHNAERAGSDPDGPEADAEVRLLHQLIGRITRYESRFRADGILADGKQVRSVLAWDYGRASGMARWGLASGYCDLAEAESAIVRAGRNSQDVYRSWEDFAAGYILGRCLHFDEEEFGTWYQESVEAHGMLTTDPGSPWVNIPWA
ncbi:DUF1266 domain-containing protein [Streptomyces sp. UNOC14_S4]|uniref:DUF1266 domain-containing protein n=1 Tax=Streptomyces sp. UNOC14_S4 TaxID=2872340 RepID=UPI001E6135C8|nr:DUF1266 domain-containing protein [Streptomyces sp. UNOC14_S4]MCC3768384.1 DUF1266 domain-containing protein [Streptomyces sp. UNOC14_S4]